MAMPCSPGCQACYQNCKGRTNYKGHWGYQAPRKSQGLMAMKHIRPSSPNADKEAAGPIVPIDATFSLRYPALWEFLVEMEWSEGVPRETGTLLVFAEDGVVKACLSDRDGDRRAFYGSDSFQGLLEGLNKGLLADTLDWRKNKFPQKKKK